MPPPARVRGVNDNSLADFFRDLAPVTRLLLVTYLITGLGAALKVVPLAHMYHAWGLEFTLKTFPQLWRMVTNFMFIGGPSFKFLFQLLWLVQYGGAYEKAKHGHNVADAITMLAFGMAATLAVDRVVPFFSAPFQGPVLVIMLVYLWSKQNPDTQVSLFGLIKFKALFLPFAFLAIDLIQGQPITTALLGILVGHLYYYLTEIYPRATGVNLIRTPQWLSRLVYSRGWGPVPIAAVNPVNPSDARFRAFSGRGQKLN